MKIATLAVMNDDGHQVWTGSALDFVRANQLSRDEVTEMCATLRGVPGMPPEPCIMGGGAAATSYVLLVMPDDAPEHCWKCDAVNPPEYLWCAACSATWRGDEARAACA